jgi:hypothetical protein
MPIHEDRVNQQVMENGDLKTDYSMGREVKVKSKK